jgi:negative regulator of sigma E activity
MDEAEQLDARRSMAQKNLDFAERWMELRYRQVDSILTLPTSSALDKRLEELADIWINVTSTGHADVYHTTVNDRSKEINQIPIQTLSWPDISDHPIKQGLDEKKREKVEEKNEVQKESEGRNPTQIKKDTRDDLIKSFYEVSDMSLRDITEAVDVGRSRVGEIVKDD